MGVEKSGQVRVCCLLLNSETRTRVARKRQLIKVSQILRESFPQLHVICPFTFFFPKLIPLLKIAFKFTHKSFVHR